VSPRQELIPTPSTSEMTEWLYQALAEPLGIVVRASDVARARAKFYNVRRDLMDPELNHLRFVAWPDGQIAICKGREAPIPEPEPRGEAKPKGKLALKDLGFD
jgi:hypothetical protein